MKKILSIISAGLLAVLAFSCTKEEDKAVINTDTQITAPVLLSAVANEDGVTVQYTPAKFATSFNSKLPVYHTLAMVKVGGKEVNQTLANAKDDGIAITISAKNLSAALRGRGYKAFDEVPVEVVVRAAVQDPARGITSGYHDSAEKYAFQWIMPEEVAGCPYEGFDADSEWSVIGALSAYEISWDGDLNMWTNGNQHVAAHVTLKAGDEFKFRKDQDWGVNMGGEFGSKDSEFPVTQDGANIKVGADGVYDLYLDPDAGTAWITDAYDPYPDYTESSNWSIIGSIAAYDNSWNKDLPMVSDGTNHAAFAVIIGASDEFKFRQDADWGVNLGGEFSELGADISVSQDGPNIKVGVAGVYDIFVNPSASTAVVAEASGLKISAKIGGDEPGPEPPAVTGWNIIGLNGDWDNDIIATQDGDVWTAFITAKPADGEETTTFKWRKDAAWDENYGIAKDAPYTLGVPFAAVAGGENIPVAAGFYKVVLDLTDAEAPTITVSNGDVYSLIGNINGTSWDTDFELAEEAGVFTSELVYIDGGFKIRHNFSWADEDTYGAETDEFTPEMGAAFKVAQPGKDIKLPGANYRVQFTLATMEVVITRVDYELPEIDLTQYDYLEAMAGAETWGLIGPAQPGKWDTDTDLQKIQDDPEIWAVMNIPLQGDKFKFRGNDTWGDYDLGGGASFEMDTPIVMTKGGGDMTAVLGVYTIYLYPTYGLLYITEGSGDVPPPPAKPTMWSLVGTIGGTSWDADLDMTNVSGDIWEVRNVAVTASDEFKIRADHDWGTSVGGPEANSTSTIDPANPYDVYKPVIGTAFEAGSYNIQIGVAGNYNITFDYENLTILIEEYKEYPEQLFMIGEEFGNWSWESDGVVEMTPVLHNPEWGANAEGQFYTVRYFSANKGFKFCSKRAWSGDFWGLETNDGFVESGGNCTVTADGFYLVHIDFKASKVHVEPAKVYGIGDAFGGWDEAVADNLFVADGTTLKATVKAAGNLRMYVASEISTSGWWTREFNIIDGKIVYRLMDELSAPAVLKDQVAVLDFNAGTGEIQGEGEQPSADYADYIYAIGGDTGWSGVYPLRSAQTSGVNNGKYKGFGYLSDQFKFKPNENDWTGDWECVGDGQIGQGSDNCPAPATAGYYMIEVDLTAMTYSLTLINSIGIIGPAQTGGWDSDTDMTYNATNGAWEVKNITLSAGDMKFRANDAWAINWGGALDALIQDGGNIAATAGTYDIALFAWCDGKAYATLTPAGGAQISITIDGDMSDWAGVPDGLSSTDGPYLAFKATYDADYLYFYSKRTWHEGLWKDSSGGYYYFELDTDNDPTTGTHDVNGNTGYGVEYWMYLYLFTGTKDAPTFATSPAGSAYPSSSVIENVIANGVTDKSVIETEVRVPRANVGLTSGGTIRIYTWGNKSAGNLKSETSYLTLTLE